MSSFDIKFPNITAPTESGKIEQIRSYLFQLADQLKWALNSIESSGEKVLQQGNQSTSKELTEKEAQASFNSVKALIIKSADIVNAYYEQFNERFVGEYVAHSDFGTYMDQTTQEINKNSTEMESLFANLQQIITDIENLEHSLIEVNAHIRSGLLFYDDEGVPIYGLEIGQKNTVEGQDVFNKYARFTSDRLSFYDQNDTEVAYISDFKLYITNAQITGTLTLGRYELDTSNGLAFKWV
jgi:hypothetical protein